MATVYVISKNGQPLMPTTRCGHVRHLLNSKLAKVINLLPFTIQLLFDTDEVTQPLYLGIDPGRTNIGLCVINEKAESVFTGQVETRNKDIPKLMAERKVFRQKHRAKRRRAKRQRRAKANGTVKAAPFERKLPQCDKNIICHDIKNKEAKFSNRKRPDGWLTPTANQLLQTHINTVKKLAKFLPITDIVLEVNKFAFMLLDDETVSGLDFCNGSLKDFGTVEAKVSAVQHGKCLLCNQPIEHFHHIVPKHKNGSETVANCCGLCKKHHDLVHIDKVTQDELSTKATGLLKKYGALGVLNQIFPKLMKELNTLYPGKLHLTAGNETNVFRTVNSIEKQHWLDAFCIACSVLDVGDVTSPSEKPYLIKQYRRHDRQACHKEMVNRNYKLNGKTVATNRNKAFEQTSKSLDEYISQGGKTDNLTVQKHLPIYKRLNRIMPGAIFSTPNGLSVLHGSSGLYKGQPQYYKFENNERYTPKKCALISKNTGLVVVSKTAL